jgi:hypothetical protein
LVLESGIRNPKSVTASPLHSVIDDTSQMLAVGANIGRWE